MEQRKSAYRMGIIIIGILFFIFGFVTWLNATLIPYLRTACDLQEEWQGYLVTVAFYIAYLVTALPSSWVLRRTGYKNGMMLGLLIMAVGALLFIPAAMMRTYGLFLLGLFIMGTGLSILQTASNPYVIELGPPESGAQRQSIMGICNKGAGVLGTWILGSIMLKDMDGFRASLESMDAVARAAALDELAAKAIVPYIIIMASLILLALFVRFSPLPQIEDPEEDVSPSSTVVAHRSIWSFPHLWLGILTLFLYVGVETIAVDTIIDYGKSFGMSMDEARLFSTWTIVCMIVGYMVGIVCVPRYLSQQRALGICAVLGILLSLLVVTLPEHVSIWCVSLLGVANSLMWPAIFPLAIYGLGSHTKTGSALLIMAIAGGAVLPLLLNLLAGVIGHQSAYWMTLPCYLFILYYAVAGYRVGLKH